MKPERWSGIVLVVALLIVGALLGYILTRGDTVGAGEVDAFRDWFWSRRGLDLMVQVGLIFAGALGVSAVLPGRREEDSDLCTWL